MSSIVLNRPRLKVKRANSHIDILVNESSVLPKDLYEIVNGASRSLALLAQPDGFALTYRPKESITDYFGPIIGDAVNNLREAMDYWINAALTLVGSGRKAYFPFSEHWKYLETSPNYPSIKKSFPELADFILNNIRPCRDTNLHLWAATSLCNLNKHNDFVPIISNFNFGNINATIGTNTFEKLSVSGDANHPITVFRSDTRISINNEFSTSVEIRFPKGAIFENKPVIPTLVYMSEVVTQTLDALDDFIRPYIR